MISKQNYRNTIRETLLSLSKERREEASKQAFDFLQKSFIGRKEPILSFASKFPELDLWPFNHYLLESHLLLLPRVEDCTLVVYQVEALSALTTSFLGIQEPNPTLCKKFPLPEISHVLVPGIGFDDRGYRVGYGKGYYDKFLPSLPLAQTWGLGFKEQQIPQIPHETHDIPVNKLFLF